MDTKAPMVDLKAGKARKKKEPDILEVERQKELVRYMKRWLSGGKGRTQSRLHDRAEVATTTISDAFKPGTITNTENTLAILKVIATPKEFLMFIAKFFPVLASSMDFAIKGITKTSSTMQDFAEFAEKTMDVEGNILQDAMNSVKEGMTIVFNNGLLYPGPERSILVGGKVSGTIVMVGRSTFQNLLDTKQEAFLKVGGLEYKLHSADPEWKIAVFLEKSKNGLVVVYSSEVLTRMREKAKPDPQPEQ